MKPQKTIQLPAFPVDVTVDELANWFWMLSLEDKVEFFNSLARQEADWFGEAGKGADALYMAASNPNVTDDAKTIIKTLYKSIA